MQAPRRPFWRSAAPIGFCLIAFLAALMAAGFIGFANSLEREERPLEIEAESVVALTGGSDRVFEAAGLLARRQAHLLLITGVNPMTRGAALERILPISRELFECCVDLGYQAQDTEGNARETRDWMQRRALTGPLIVVTSNYHMPRALLELQAALPGVELHPYPVVSEHVRVESYLEDRRVLRLLLREYFKYLRALGRTRWDAVSHSPG
ncbi:MAG: YdcF family protein [Methylocystis sp.]